MKAVVWHGKHIEDAPMGYEIFTHKQNNCIKIVLDPHAAKTNSAAANEQSVGQQEPEPYIGGDMQNPLKEELHEIPTPSQAEGDDDEKLDHEPIARTTPSQAEGDEQTVDEDLAARE